MVKSWQAGQRRWLALLGLGLGSALASGCSGTPHAQAPPHDPLHGVLTPPGVPQPTYAPKTATGGINVQPLAGGVPATPASMTSSNTAALAGTSWQGKANAFEDNQFGPPFLPGQTTLTNKSTPQVPPPNAAPKVEAIPDVKPPTASNLAPTGAWQSEAPPVQPTKAIIPASAAQLSKQLEERGVLNQKQETVPEGVHLTCYLSRGPQGGIRIVEVTAADYASAAQAILQQLDGAR